MYKLYINGEMVRGNGKCVKVLNPADNSLITELDTASAEQCEEALAAAKAAFKGWAATPIGVRIEWLVRLGDAIQEEKEHIAELLSSESGKPYYLALEDLAMFDRFLRYFAEEGKRIDGTTVYTPAKAYGELYHMVERRALGVVVGHIAWNYPVGMMALKLGPAMVAGDPIIIKPASSTPLSTLYVGEICERIGLPRGVVNIVCGPASVVAKTLNSSTIPSMVTLIGSSDTGRQAMQEACSSSIKRFSMELGGNAPVIIMPDADMDSAVENTVSMKMWNAGQDCCNYNRIYVHEDIYETYLEKVTQAAGKIRCGSGHDEGGVMGPMITREARDRMFELIGDAVEKGAGVLCGGHVPNGLEDGNFIELTVLRDVTEDMRVSREEIFGPIIAVRKFSTLDDALTKANDTDMGLASYFFGHDARDIARAFETLETGDVFVNGGNGGAHTPHIGMKQSGVGCDQSRWSLEEYFQLRRISMVP